MKKESKSLESVKGSKVDTNKVHGGKMDNLPDNLKEINIKDFAQDIAIKRGEMSRGDSSK